MQEARNKERQIKNSSGCLCFAVPGLGVCRSKNQEARNKKKEARNKKQEARNKKQEAANKKQEAQ